MTKRKNVKRWKQYLQQLLNIENEVYKRIPTFHEIKDVMASLKVHKAPGNDYINGELLKKVKTFYTKNIYIGTRKNV